MFYSRKKRNFITSIRFKLAYLGIWLNLNKLDFNGITKFVEYLRNVKKRTVKALAFRTPYVYRLYSIVLNTIKIYIPNFKLEQMCL